MKISLEKQQLEALDLIRANSGYKALLEIANQIDEHTSESSKSVKTKTIARTDGSVIITTTETAENQLTALLEFQKGVHFLIGQIEIASKKLKELQNGKNE